MIGSIVGSLGNFYRISAPVRAAALVLFALGSLIGFGVDRAAAQTYYFDFTASFSAPFGNLPYTMDATISGAGSCTPCTLTSPTQLSGTETLVASVYSVQAYPHATFGADNEFSVTTGVTGSGLNYIQFQRECVEHTE